MSLKKTVAIAAAAGALAAISVPAMALENEFHGIYNFKTFLSNVENGGSTNIDPTGLRKDNKAHNFTQQRARIQYIAKANDDLKLVTHFELDANFGGDKTGKYFARAMLALPMPTVFRLKPNMSILISTWVNQSISKPVFSRSRTLSRASSLTRTPPVSWPPLKLALPPLVLVSSDLPRRPVLQHRQHPFTQTLPRLAMQTRISLFLTASTPSTRI